MKNIRLVIGIALAILASIGIVLMIVGYENYIGKIGATMLGLTIGYLIFSFGMVQVGEVAMMSVFGKPIENGNNGNIGKGLYFAPFGIISVRKEKGTDFQDELPADPEKIFREEGKVPDGMFPPIRVKFGQPPANPTDPVEISLSGDPYNVAMVAEVVPVVTWRIVNASTFFGVIGNVENCRKMMADKAVEVFSNDFATKTPAKATLSLGKTSQDLENKLRIETVGWGIDVADAFVKPIIFSHHLNTSVVGVKIADQNAKATIITAGAERKKRAEEAAGTAEGIKSLAEAEKLRLIATGLAKTDAGGNITNLVPDANVRAGTDAVKALAGLTGTLVLGGETQTMLGIGKKGEKP